VERGSSGQINGEQGEERTQSSFVKRDLRDSRVIGASNGQVNGQKETSSARQTEQQLCNSKKRNLTRVGKRFV